MATVIAVSERGAKKSKAPCDPVRAVIDDPYLLHKIMLINVHTELLAAVSYRLLRQLLKDHMTKMSRSIDIVNVLGLQNRLVYFSNLTSAVVHDVWENDDLQFECFEMVAMLDDGWHAFSGMIKPDHTPPKPAVLGRVAKSIANMK
eukprot:COSAG06_NODE_6436_length_2934_cov_4.263845_2_plen_146_part_00